MNFDIKQKVKDFLINHHLLDKDNSLLIGFSGGFDSLCLLNIIYELSKENDFTFTAAHLNHNWRGIESKKEEDNARQYCNSKNIAFYSETLPSDLPHTELEARNQRYEFFKRAAKKMNSTAIITGHTLTDQAETVLYRIIKGTGTIGLKGIPKIRFQDDSVPIYRPILDISREQTIEYCNSKRLNANFDSSNLNQAFLRNKIRLSLMPELKNYNKDIETALIRLSEIASDTETLVEEHLKQIKEKIFIKDEIITKEFLNLSVAAQKRILLDLLHSQNIKYDNEIINRSFNFIKENLNSKSGNTLSIAKNSWLFVSFKIIKIIHSIKSAVLKSTVIVNLNGKTCNQELEKTIVAAPWKDGKPEYFPNEVSETIYADFSKIQEPVYFRTRRPGDKIQPFGMQQKVKFKKYLINKGIPEYKRDFLPVLAMDSEILWSVGVGISELLRVYNIPTHILTIKEELIQNAYD
jgi:tRNA(Ile)-lysidine synthase